MTSSRKKVFITGISGFIGPLVLRDILLKNYSVVALLHNTDHQSAEQLKEIFRRAEIPTQYLDNVEIVRGDISVKNLSLSEKAIKKLNGEISEVWHLAASLSFRSRDKEKNFSTNVLGTKNILAFAEYLSVERIFYISTVYIRGSYTGIIYEKPIPKPSKFNNSYEETKWEAENYVLNASNKNNITTVVARLAIVVGDEKYIPQNNFGYYNFLASIKELKERIVLFPTVVKWLLRLIGLRIEGDKIYSKIPFPCTHSKHLNLVPVGIVVDFLSRIAEHHRNQARPGTYIYNIVDPNPVSLNVLFYETFHGLGIYMPIIHTPSHILKLLFKLVIFGAIFLPQIRRFSKSLFYYQNYLFNEAIYDTRNTEKIVKENIASTTFLTSSKIKEVIKGFLA